MADYQSSLTAVQIESVLLGAVVHNSKTSLSEQQKAQARENIGAGSSDTGMTILGYFDTLDDLAETVIEPTAGSAYGVGKSYPYDIYIWDALKSQWVNNGNIRGADGADGSDARVTAGAVVTALGFKPEAQKLHFINTIVAADAFVIQGEPIHKDYPYMAAVPLSGVRSNMFPQVTFGIAEAVAGVFAPVAASYDGGIYIYAAKIPANEISIPTIMCWLGDEATEGSLPREYKQVEYVEGSKCYINTGFKPSNNTRLYAKVQFSHGGTEGFLFGAQSGATARDKFTFRAPDGESKYIGGFGANDLSINTTPGQPFILDINKTAVRVSDFETEHESASFACTYPLYLFAGNIGGTATETKEIKRIYSCNIYENDVLVRQFVPCYRLSDFSAGLYDLVTRMFYAPAVGTLTAGMLV